MKLILGVLLCCFSAGCVTKETGVKVRDTFRKYGPETGTLTFTDPNLFNGPAAATRNGQSRRDAFGVLGLSVGLTWRFKKIQIERVEPASSPTPAPSPYPANDHGYRNH